jgi:hypothetical protein
MLFASTLIVAIASAHFISVIASNDVTVYGMNPRIPRAAPFGINIGSDNTDTVAWIAGQSQCNHVPLGPLFFDQSVSLLTNALMLRLEPTHVADLSISMMTDHSLLRVAVAISLGPT